MKLTPAADPADDHGWRREDTSESVYDRQLYHKGDESTRTILQYIRGWGARDTYKNPR